MLKNQNQTDWSWRCCGCLPCSCGRSWAVGGLWGWDVDSVCPLGSYLPDRLWILSRVRSLRRHSSSSVSQDGPSQLPPSDHWSNHDRGWKKPRRQLDPSAPVGGGGSPVSWWNSFHLSAFWWNTANTSAFTTPLSCFSRSLWPVFLSLSLFYSLDASSFFPPSFHPFSFRDTTSPPGFCF